ncbi:MAG: hypothetical protein CBD47_03385 [Synechococcus sp. TMED187]|nr:MAG: hypothetical protein CBD47_03385 [Synechococcus sp. TMED187]
MNPFEYVKAINTTKKDIMVDDIAEKEYNAFMVNRSLSNFQDTVLYANLMNVNHHIDARLQFDFFINTIRKKNRFSKWLKPMNYENLEVIKEYYGYSNEKAKSVLSLLNNKQIEELKQRIYKGGRTKNI